jgi:transcriptional regulator with XRE-family HTH domain
MNSKGSRALQQNVVDSYVGQRLRLLRQRRRISQKDLAERIGITFQQVQKYEKGLNRLPASRMLAICFVLDITPNDLFKDFLTKELSSADTIEYSDQEVELIEMLRQLAPPLKTQVRQIVDTLANQ